MVWNCCDHYYSERLCRTENNAIKRIIRVWLFQIYLPQLEASTLGSSTACWNISDFWSSILSHSHLDQDRKDCKKWICHDNRKAILKINGQLWNAFNSMAFFFRSTSQFSLTNLSNCWKRKVELLLLFKSLSPRGLLSALWGIQIIPFVTQLIPKEKIS